MPSTDNQFSYAIGALALTALLLGLPGCGATTSSDMMEARIGKEFNVTGHWTGDLVDSRYGTHEIYLTLNDNGACDRPPLVIVCVIDLMCCLSGVHQVP